MTIEDLLDRRAPLAVMAAVCLQIATIVWWAATRDSDTRFLQSRIEQLEQHAGERQQAETQMIERLARIEEKLNAQASLLDHIDKQQTYTRH